MVESGFTKMQAMHEALRCLMCEDAPCACDCPAGVDAKAFIRKIAMDNISGAIRLLRERNILAGSCAYICPSGRTCTGACTATALSTPIDIPKLQRYCMDYDMQNHITALHESKKTAGKIAIIGAGPAGLACAATCCSHDYDVHVFEKANIAGGMLALAIPDFRLPAKMVAYEVSLIEQMGTTFHYNHAIMNPKELLAHGYDAVFVGVGLTQPRPLPIDCEAKNGVHHALDLLAMHKRGESLALGDSVIVIGGGDTAMDIARVVKRLNKECRIVYRRSPLEIPAYAGEVWAAWNEGIEFNMHMRPVGICGNDHVSALTCTRVTWTKDDQGKDVYTDVDTPFNLSCADVVFAIGQGVDSHFNFTLSDQRLISINSSTWMTDIDGIFSGGDIVNGGKTAVMAVGQGRLAADAMHEWVTQRKKKIGQAEVSS